MKIIWSLKEKSLIVIFMKISPVQIDTMYYPRCTTTMSWNKVIFIARQWSCGKVMFSLVCVCQSTGGRVSIWPLSMMHWTSLYRPSTSDMEPPQPQPQSQPPSTSDILWPLLETCSNLFTWGCPAPTVLTYGGYQSTYGWPAGSTHPTGMLSCVLIWLHFSVSNSIKNIFG